MSLRLSEMFPSIETGLNRVGFLFGAGASKEAGYPLMSDLTKFVVSSLSAANRTTLAAKKSAYEPASGTPDIEALSDLSQNTLLLRKTQSMPIWVLEPPRESRRPVSVSHAALHDRLTSS